MKDGPVKRFLLKKYYFFLHLKEELYQSRYAVPSYFQRNKLKIMDTPTTIKCIIDENKSVARFGDGELSAIFNSQKFGFQKWSPMLAKRLSDCLTDQHDNLMICMPRYLIDTSNCNAMAKKFWHHYRRQNLHFALELVRSTCGFDYVFGDTQMTRAYIDLKDKKFSESIFSSLKKIWENKDLFIVEGSQTCLGVGNDLFSGARSIKRIECPNENAFESYDKILNCVLDRHSGELVLAALGPTATVLAADLSDCGIQCIDLGHIDIEYEWFLAGAQEPVPVENKYTNLDGGRTPADCTERAFLDSIIARID